VSQEVGLAAAVAASFLGSPVALAAGGAALFQNMRLLAFPGTDFHSAFAQSTSNGSVALCSKLHAQRSRMRPAYLWMVSIPDAAPPAISLLTNTPVGIGVKSEVKLASKQASDLRLVPRARNWRLASGSGSASLPIAVDSSGGLLHLDLTQAKIKPGQYCVVADWDWTPMEIAGTIELRPFADFNTVKLTPDSADGLIAGKGKVDAWLTGADFEFVSKVALDGGDGDPQLLSFTVLKPAHEGARDKLRVELDTAELSPGTYRLGLTQSNGQTQGVPVTVHAPNPYVANLPLRANLGEKEQKIQLKGSGLDRIEKIISPGATWDLNPVPAGAADLTSRRVVIRLSGEPHPGQRLSALMSVAGIEQPIAIPEAIEVAGPRPRILAVQPAFPQGAVASLRPGELPAGLALSFSIRTENASDKPALELGCLNPSDTISALRLQVASTDPRFRLDLTGENALFLSLDPATVGRSGCKLAVTVSSVAAGPSDPYELGRVVRLPRIEKFTLSDRKVERKLYAGTLTGEDLQLIEMTGWNAKHGYPVEGIPTPVSSDPVQQTLAIALPWPPPSPQAPLYIWLRGEAEARQTSARY
jgi:hypothetical protein